VLKGLYTWLRTEVHRVTTAEDPVFGLLKVPQARAAQLTKSKVVPREHVMLAVEHLAAPAPRGSSARRTRRRRP
jgi:hypothetical protein